MTISTIIAQINNRIETFETSTFSELVRLQLELVDDIEVSAHQNRRGCPRAQDQSGQVRTPLTRSNTRGYAADAFVLQK